MEKVRVLRVLEYVGDRTWVEEVVAKSIHGTLTVHSKAEGIKGEIHAATIGEYPEILMKEVEEDE